MALLTKSEIKLLQSDNRCPLCKRNKAVPKDINVDDNPITQKYHCGNCGETWELTFIPTKGNNDYDGGDYERHVSSMSERKCKCGCGLSIAHKHPNAKFITKKHNNNVRSEVS